MKFYNFIQKKLENYNQLQINKKMLKSTNRVNRMILN